MTLPRKLRVLQIIDNLGMGGAEVWLMALLRHWREEGCGAPQMDFLATGGRPGVFDEEARALGARIVYLRFGHAQISAFRQGFRHLLRTGNYDALHSHADYASGWHYLLGAGLLPPVRITHVHNPIYQATHNYGVSLRRSLTARAGKRLVGHFASHILGTSRQALTEHGFDDVRFDKVQRSVLHCAFDTSNFVNDANAHARIRAEFGWPAGTKIILFAGRIDGSPDPADSQTHKNSALAVQMAIEASCQDLSVCAIFVGPPSPATSILKQQIAAVGLADRIRLVGIRRDIATLMQASDVLLFPSRGEGLGMVAVEAQAAGLPVLASDAVPRECVVVPHLVHFMSVAEGVAPWAEALLKLAETPRDAHSANRLITDSAFSIVASARSLAAIYGSGNA